ncbi:3'(2'),5'-bisphosphate nucleotidase CysQ [Rhizobium leguminosarum]|uniref:3'(2'),5'-bisphosphate nucleotidase CysQ family protein n=1 Tax=Rhizobium leguminosarum TaxID=384 RepID=UPI002484B5ED|nr:inositol monophosphatase family protein [Rhizobium leguminosarum]
MTRINDRTAATSQNESEGLGSRGENEPVFEKAACRSADLVIRKAGDAALALQDDDVAVRGKQDGSPVTSADLASNDILGAACLALFPAMRPVVSEEDSRVFEARKDSDSVLVIDPLDGTKEFIKGRDEFAVNIAPQGFKTAAPLNRPARKSSSAVLASVSG